ncbi:DEKNAAC105004 [Brettanomyces naardenensis]|uniref:DEKNAAC105004 n=1 Tax=Brettanomyces naardenensis TaxID=13370 RepID=A0A448YSA8_BRENA|nr:DEKNAAC105004 [Brettanomyces naardenensis]
MDLTKLYDHASPEAAEQPEVVETVEPEAPQSAAESTTPSLPSIRLKRTTKEYRMLYCYLLAKFHNVNEKFKNTKGLQSRSESLIKFLDLRNAMLVDILKYIDHSEELRALSPLSRRKEADYLNRIAKADPSLLSALQPLLDLPDNEALKDPLKLRKAIESMHPSSETNHALYMLENNSLPDIYSESDYEDLFDKVKRNRFYIHDTLRYADPKRKVMGLTEPDWEPDQDSARRRKPVKESSVELPSSSLNAPKVRNVVLKFSGQNKLKYNKVLARSSSPQSDEVDVEVGAGFETDTEMEDDAGAETEGEADAGSQAAAADGVLQTVANNSSVPPSNDTPSESTDIEVGSEDTEIKVQDTDIKVENVAIPHI